MTTGGPAFPVVIGDGVSPPWDGMSLRDWFAGQALAGWYAAIGQIANPGDARSRTQAVAKEVYVMADAMLAERTNG